MSTGADDAVTNPCLACTIEQDCCRHLTGLRLTEVEFERTFARYSDLLTIARDGPAYVISLRDGGACPYWRDGGCSAYEDRPRECRLFPHSLYIGRRTADAVTLRYHSDTRCPLKQNLLADTNTAETLVRGFGREAFGDHVRIEVAAETPGERRWRRLRAAAHNWLAALRGR